MPDEQRGLGPAGIEQGGESPEGEGSLVTPESAIEQSPAVPEREPAAPEKSGKYEKLLQSVSQATPLSGNDADAQSDVTQVQAEADEAKKIEQLVQLAHTKGLPHAVRVAEGLKDYYALDMFHDTLVDNLYDELLKEGLITKE